MLWTALIRRYWRTQPDSGEQLLNPERRGLPQTWWTSNVSSAEFVNLKHVPLTFGLSVTLEFFSLEKTVLNNYLAFDVTLCFWYVPSKSGGCCMCVFLWGAWSSVWFVVKTRAAGPSRGQVGAAGLPRVTLPLSVPSCREPWQQGHGAEPRPRSSSLEPTTHSRTWSTQLSVSPHSPSPITLNCALSLALLQRDQNAHTLLPDCFCSVRADK